MNNIYAAGSFLVVAILVCGLAWIWYSSEARVWALEEKVKGFAAPTQEEAHLFSLAREQLDKYRGEIVPADTPPGFEGWWEESRTPDFLEKKDLGLSDKDRYAARVGWAACLEHMTGQWPNPHWKSCSEHPPIDGRPVLTVNKGDFYPTVMEFLGKEAWPHLVEHGWYFYRDDGEYGESSAPREAPEWWTEMPTHK